ncbi:hypothetical protein VOLCADRAFT_107691 [Volvox carteri f. nagariensis]|uniref:Macro domain-containing protein n=1 Tax=Volvox carteri f. nagariensis TaxID=3068 RepID=D8UFN4_VOLCA|nr:uncharacterized protein VOLCADRAFT_107691 [Volvox carteri f. nagariensis]EFJ41489.1 hypothetical protein VOLCADRAFT_107691 [Volvox carteri f. nagariensis]|eukprot:XP_002957434.1 hypothetical protein VOLCADRAFT_107691 [Volvox carteri f. nagariensis]
MGPNTRPEPQAVQQPGTAHPGQKQARASHSATSYPPLTTEPGAVLSELARDASLLFASQRQCHTGPDGRHPGSGGAINGMSLQQLLHVSRQLVRLRLRSRNPGAGTPGCSQVTKGPTVVMEAHARVLDHQGAGFGTHAAVASASDILYALVEELAVSAACQLESQDMEEPIRARSTVARAIATAQLRSSAAAAGDIVADDDATNPVLVGVGGAGAAAARCGAALLHNLVKLWDGGGVGGGGLQRLAEAVAAAATRQPLVSSLDSRSLQDLIWALGKLDSSVNRLPAVGQLVSALAARLTEPGLLDHMSPVGLSMVVYGMGKLGVPYPDISVRRAVAAAVAASAPSCEPQALANMAWGFSRTAESILSPPATPSWSGTPASAQPQLRSRLPGWSSTPSPARGSEAPELAACVELCRSAVRQLDRFKPREAANLLGGLAALGALTDPRVRPLLDAIVSYLHLRLGELGPQDLAELLYVYAIAAAPAPAASRELVATRHHDWNMVANTRPTDQKVSLLPNAVQEMQAQLSGGHPTGSAGVPALDVAAATASGVHDVEGALHQALHNSEMWALLEQRCLELLPLSPAYQVATMLWAFAHLTHRPTGLLSAVTGALTCQQGAAAGNCPGAQRGKTGPSRPAPVHSANAATPNRVGPAPTGVKAGRPSSDPGVGPQAESGSSRGRSHSQQHHAGRPGQHLQPPRRSSLELRTEGARGAELVMDLESLPPAQVARLVWALARLSAGVPPAGLRRLCGPLRSRMAEFDTQSLLMMAWGLATLGCPGDAVLELVVGRLTALLPSLEPDQLPMALWSVAKLMTTDSGSPLPGMSVMQFFHASRGPLAMALPRLAPQGVAMAAWAYATAGVNPGEAGLAALWERAVAVAVAAAAAAPSTGVGEDAGQALAMLTSAMAEFRCRHVRLTRAVLVAAAAHMAALQQIQPRQPYHSQQQQRLQPASGGNGETVREAAFPDGVWLSSVICSLGRLGVCDGRVLQLACRRAVALAPVLTPREAVPLLWGLGVLAKRIGRTAAAAAAGDEYGTDGSRRGGSLGADAALLDAVAALTGVIEPVILDAAADCSPHANRVASTALRRGGGGSSIRAATVAAGGAASCCSNRRAAALDGGLLSMFLIACVAHRHRPDAVVLEATSLLLRRHLRSLASHTLCEIAWALAVLRPPPGGNMGIHAMLPLAEKPSVVDNAVAPNTDAVATTTASGWFHPDPVSCRFRGRSASAAGGVGASADSVRGHGDAVQGLAAASTLSPFAVHSPGSGDPGSCVAGNAKKGEEVRIDAKPAQSLEGCDDGSGGSVHAAVRRRMLSSLLRWSRPEVPLVLAALLQRRRRRRRPRAAAGGAAPLPHSGMTATTDPKAVSRSAADSNRRSNRRARDAGGVPPCDSEQTARPEGVPLTPRASLVAPIYPPRHTVPEDQVCSQRLLECCLRLLGRRLCVERSELLTLESLVKVTWAMCVLRMYTPRCEGGREGGSAGGLFRYCAARALCCSTAPLEPRPALLRALVQVRALVARQRPSTWDRLRLRSRWRRRQKTAGVNWNVTPAALAADAPATAARRLQRCRASLDAAADAAGMLLEWRNTYEGDRHGVMRLGSRSSCALLLVPPWEEAEGPGRHRVMEEAAPQPPLAFAAVAARLLLLRGWLVVCVRVEQWLGLEPEEQRRQLVALHAQMREAARVRAEAAVAAAGAANERMLGGGGVDGAIHRAAGPELVRACAEVPEVRPGVRCPTGEARITPGFKLKARHVIHTVGPIYENPKHSAPLLAGAYRSSLQLALERGLKSVSFPGISTGVFGYPFDEAAEVALAAVDEALDAVGEGGSVKEVRFVLFNQPLYDAFVEAAEARSARATSESKEVPNPLKSTEL